MTSLRKILFWAHLATGAVAGVVIFIMSVTGVLLTYQRQIVAWTDRDHWTPAPATATRLPVDSLLAIARASDPEAKPTSLTVRANPQAPVSVAMGRGRVLDLDPYSGTARGDASPTVRALFRNITDAHRWLSMKDASRDTARAITGAANLAFLFLVLSGLFLWVPRKLSWTQWRAVLFFRGSLRGKARDFNWHHVFGIWCAVPLAIVVASGVVISYPWASALVYRAMGEQPPAPTAQAAPAANAATAQRREAPDTLRARTAPKAPAVQRLSLEELTGLALARADAETPEWRSLIVQLPDAKAAKMSFTVDEGDGGQPQLRRTLAYDRSSGALLTNESFATLSPGRRMRSILRFAHTGEVLGFTGQTIAGIVSFAAALLVWTGLALSLRRLAARMNRTRVARA